MPIFSQTLAFIQTTMRALFIFFLILTSFKATSQQANDSLYRQVDDIKALANEFPVGAQLSMAIISDGEIEYYGMLKQKDGIKYISNEDSLFEIGSLTKIFTTTLLCQYLVAGKIEQTDKINPFLPFKIKKKITFEQLANHTAGLPRLPSNIYETVTDLENPYANYSEEIFEYYLKNDLVFETKPGQKSNYSNLGIGLLGYVLSKIDNVDYKILVSKNILSKFDMSHTGFELDRFKDLLVDPYNSNGSLCKNWEWSSSLCAAGGLKSNTRDLVKFITAHFDDKNEELRLGTISTFVVNDKIDMGVGWHILKKESNHPVLWHNGISGGYTSSLVIDLDRKNAVVILSNQTTVSLDKLAIDIITISS
jgi:CubicO group peptidase (beta-lactamase class C family)